MAKESALFAKPNPDQLALVYQRLMAGNAAAREELAQLALEPLAKVLSAGWGRDQDADMAHDAAVDAIMDLIVSPCNYTPALSSLWSFLKMAGRRNLVNIRTSEKRRYARIARLQKNVALCPPARNTYEAGVDRLAEREVAEVFGRRVNGVVGSLSPTEVEVFNLMASGVRATLGHARVLGIIDAPPEDQALTVKRAKDRLRKRLRRLLRSTLMADLPESGCSEIPQ